MDEAKYKTLKSKHDLLKDAFKKLYTDYETLKGDLTSKIEEYAKLHEENTHLKHSYDLLTDEVSLQNQKSNKLGPSSWTNPLTLIKGTGQQSVNDADNYQKFNEEIASLKSRLESSIKENEMLQVQNLQTTRDLEDSKAKHNVVVTELKDRLIALESILKDLQDQSNKNEIKLSQYSSEIKSLNLEMDNKLNEINNLNRSLENVKKDHERDSHQWKLKLNEKFKLDLRRNNFINFNNIYQNSNELDTLGETFSTHELFRVLLTSFRSFFDSWRSSLKFSESSRIATDEVPQSSDTGVTESQDTNDNFTFSSFATAENSQVSKNMDLLVDKIDNLLLKISNNLGAILSKMEDRVFDSVQYSNLSDLVQNLKEFFKLQRVYFCVEEYLVPYDTNNKKEGNKKPTKQLINILGAFSRVVTRFYNNLKGVLFLIQAKKRNLSGLLFMVLNKESVCTTSQPDSVDLNLSSERYQYYESEIHTLSAVLENSSKNMYSLVKQLTAVKNELKESLSHRMCYPKFLNKRFLPFSGGTNQMVHLTYCLSSLEKDLVHLTEYRVNTALNYLFNSLKFFTESQGDDDLSKNNFELSKNNYDLLKNNYDFNNFESSKNNFDLSNNNYESLKNNDDLNNFDFSNCSVQTHSAISYVNECNESLSKSQPRIKIVNLEHDLLVAKRNENELSDLKLKFSDMEELLSMATHRSERYENELDSLKKTNLLESMCSKMFNELEAKYLNYKFNSEENEKSQETAQVEQELMETNKKIKKLTTHIKHLLKTVTSLEDSNKQLKLALELNKDQYKMAKENEDSIHKNYNEQLVLMSEHISELNNAILSSEYKIAELTQTKVSCPSCGFNNTLGSMMGVDDKGRCSSCRCIVIFSTN